MPFTREQQFAIDARNPQILVAAAAGSGKTAVLVQRVVCLITNIEKPVDIDRLLIVTYTEAAAAEMRQRLSDAITALLAERPKDRNLLRQQALLPCAQISTIHAFCRRVLKNKFYLVDMDPEFKVMDQAEQQLIKAQVIEELFEDEYAREENTEGENSDGDATDFCRLVDSYGGGKTKDTGLSDLVLKIADTIESTAFPEYMLDVYLKRLEEAYTDLEGSVWHQIIMDDIKREIRAIISEIERAIQISRSPGGPAKYIPALQSDMDIALRLYDAETMHEVKRILDGYSSEKLASVTKKDEVDPELKEKVQSIRKKGIKENLDALRNGLMYKDIDEQLADLRAVYPLMTDLTRLIKEYRKRYKEAKKERNLVDFGDLEHFCIEILTNNDPENPLPSAAADEIKKRYEEIMVDEYQDANRVQELIVSSIAGRRFMVGDVKQSIYRFRSADPGIFNEKYNSFTDAQLTDDASEFNETGEAVKVVLSKNFRSRGEVLDTVNKLFRQIMHTQLGGIEYDTAAELNLGAEFLPCEDTENNRTEILLIDPEVPEQTENSEQKQNHETSTEPDETDTLEEISNLQAEARVIGRRIDELVNGGMLVTDKQTQQLRPCKYSDIVILVRSIGSIADAFTEELKRCNVPAYADVAGSFFSAVEVKTACAFLRVIDNPYQDIDLVTVLYSPVYMLTADELMDIRLYDRKAYFYDCLRGYITQHRSTETEIQTETELCEKLERFLSDLMRWREQAIYTPVSRLIDIVYNETGYFEICGRMAGGRIRQTNLRTLYERAIAYEKTNFRGLFQFLRYAERLEKREDDRNGAVRAAESENSVTIMTIHKSKGLEFPVVFVSMFGKRFNREDEKSGIVIHPTLGFGPVYVDLDKRIKSNTLVRMCITKQIRLENIAEEMRVLYVALTRAKEKLILTGTMPDAVKKLASYRENPGSLHKAQCYLDMIIPYCEDIRICSPVDAMGIDVIGIDNGNVTGLEQFGIENTDALRSETQLWAYPYKKATTLPVKVSISEIKRKYQENMTNAEGEAGVTMSGLPTGQVGELPEFMEKKRVSNVRKGTAIHTIVEHMDLNVDNCDEKYVAMLIENLKHRNMLDEDEARAVEIEKIVRFGTSELAERMRKSGRVYRETPFVMSVSQTEAGYVKPGIKTEAGCSDESLTVHGIIDCFFVEKNGSGEEEMVLVDFKSDYINPSEAQEDQALERITQRYRIQTRIYKKAVERSTGKRVKEVLLYLFSIDRIVRME